MPPYVLAFLIGVIAGLRSLTARAVQLGPRQLNKSAGTRAIPFRIRKATPIGCVGATPDSAPFQTFSRPPEF
jgi:hypothetical protein